MVFAPMEQVCHRRNCNIGIAVYLFDNGLNLDSLELVYHHIEQRFGLI